MHWLTLVATVCWAANIIAVKIALRGFGPLALVELRVLGAAVLFGGLFCGRRSPLAFGLTAREWQVTGLLALCGVTFNQLFFVEGVARTSVVHTGLIVALGPVMVLVLACLMRLEALTMTKFAGTLIAFAGVAILTTGKTRQGNSGHWQGDLMILAGSVVFAYYTILVKEVSARYDALTLNTLVFGMGALWLTPFGVRELLHTRWTAVPVQAWWSVAYMIVFGSALPYLIFAFVLTELAASRVAAFNYLQPVIASALGIWLLSERLTLAVVLGGAIILLGVYLTERERSEEGG
jgi:drug/metabolite transporter (DMT)-like permease